jgi:hypothetical protein
VQLSEDQPLENLLYNELPRKEHALKEQPCMDINVTIQSDRNSINLYEELKEEAKE